MIRKFIGLAGLACALTSIGCAGATTEIVAGGAKVPISLSRGLRDHDGSIVTMENQEVVGHFSYDRTAWGMLYSFASLTPETDISEAINTQVAAAKGDAVVRLAVRSKPCALNYVAVLNWLPFFPGCSNIEIAGDIVRVRRGSSAAGCCIIFPSHGFAACLDRRGWFRRSCSASQAKTAGIK